MSCRQVLDLSLALCNALEYLHDVAVPGRIVCHRDLKPDNIGFAEDGTLKLIDFGLGKVRWRVRRSHMQKRSASFTVKGGVGVGRRGWRAGVGAHSETCNGQGRLGRECLGLVDRRGL